MSISSLFCANSYHLNAGSLKSPDIQTYRYANGGHYSITLNANMKTHILNVPLEWNSNINGTIHRGNNVLTVDVTINHISSSEGFESISISICDFMVLTDDIIMHNNKPHKYTAYALNNDGNSIIPGKFFLNLKDTMVANLLPQKSLLVPAMAISNYPKNEIENVPPYGAAKMIANNEKTGIEIGANDGYSVFGTVQWPNDVSTMSGLLYDCTFQYIIKNTSAHIV